MSVEIKCKHCDKVFRVTPNRKNVAKYCSKKCMIEDKKVNKENYRGYYENCFCKCGCGNLIKKSIKHRYRGIPNYIRGHFKHYKCSLETKKKISDNHANFSKENHPNWKGGKIEIKCQTCGKIFKVYPAYKNRQYCSNKCRFIGSVGKFVGRNNPHYGKLLKAKWGKYKNIMMRSSWEVAYAKYLDEHNIEWEYEPDTFRLSNTTYTPDFKLENKKYVEIKGYMTPKAYFKIKEFILNNPDIDYTILVEKDLKKVGVLNAS